MVLVLKIMSFAIWFIIMAFIVEAALHHRKHPLGSYSLYPHNRDKTNPASRHDHQHY